MSRLSKQLASDAEVAAVLVPLPARPDELLPLARAATHDADAAATLVGALCGGMLRIVRKVLGRRHPDVDDVTQDAVIALLTAIMTFRGECSVEHFANRIALLTALASRRRTRARARKVELEMDSFDDVAVAAVDAGELASPLAGALAARRRLLVRQLLDELPDVIAEALASHFILGYTVDEIAAASSVPANTVWSRLRLGKQALRKKLERDAELAEMLGGGEA
ncbi:MAG TPA: sigma-70 family RNA polymerase sigma factor [Polyangia bacterium]